jgi:hypothetical protein
VSKSQRTKGAVYEREVCARLSKAAGRKIQRNIGQARDGGTDIPFGNFLIECKRRKALGTIEKWLKQATDAATTGEQIPVVVARSDAGQSMAFLSLENFLLLVSLANA